ncbi:MAG: response regulator transcription factor [Acidimicrobiia bacterium]
MGQRVLIAEDDGLLRDALRTALELEGLEVVGEAGDADEAVLLTETLGPDIVVMDPTLPTPDGESAIENVQRRCPDTRVVVPNMHEDATLVAKALEAGAEALLTKFLGMTEVVALVRAAGDGEGAARLTKREAEILQLVANGYSTREVGEHLFISEKTVRNHLASVFRKLDARNRTEAVSRGIRLGIVELQ